MASHRGTHAGAMLCADWVPGDGPDDGGLMLVFDGDQLIALQLAGIRLLAAELDRWALLTEAELQPRQFRGQGLVGGGEVGGSGMRRRAGWLQVLAEERRKARADASTVAG